MKIYPRKLFIISFVMLIALCSGCVLGMHRVGLKMPMEVMPASAKGNLVMEKDRVEEVKSILDGYATQDRFFRKSGTKDEFDYYYVAYYGQAGSYAYIIDKKTAMIAVQYSLRKTSRKTAGIFIENKEKLLSYIGENLPNNSIQVDPAACIREVHKKLEVKLHDKKNFLFWYYNSAKEYYAALSIIGGVINSYGNITSYELSGWGGRVHSYSLGRITGYSPKERQITINPWSYQHPKIKNLVITIETTTCPEQAMDDIDVDILVGRLVTALKTEFGEASVEEID